MNCSFLLQESFSEKKRYFLKKEASVFKYNVLEEIKINFLTGTLIRYYSNGDYFLFSEKVFGIYNKNLDIWLLYYS